ncbi:MAG: transposase [Candidatus Methanoperedens sp.]|nr:transposase [Candidatus Methanoperedens sp.]MCZ7359556.1 transposase [Candidatus Methanoperedens sp.]HLB72258.1 transposase [Candidatus Methanoperedens sp.]
MSLKTKAKKSVTITITIALILFTYNTWEDYKVKYRDSLRQVVIENVERLRLCRKPQNGYLIFECPECGARKYVPFTCKSRICTSCGTKSANEWADKIHHRLLRVPYKHVVFTIPDTLWELFRNPNHQKILFLASKVTMEEMIRFSNKRSKKKVKLKIGMIQVLQTYGADMKYDPHIHSIVTEGGFESKKNWIHVDFIKYEGWRKKWQYELLTRLKKELPRSTETNTFIDRHFKNYPKGFVVYGKRRFEKREGWNMARYIGRYVKHPPIAESRITRYDGKQVTFWYEDTKTKQRITVTMDKFEFVHRLLSHVPEKNFKVVRYIGLYSRRGYKHRQTEFSDEEAVLIIRSWRDEIKRIFQYDPLLCPKCNTEMELVEICYCGTESYPVNDLYPGKPPPEESFLSQQEKVQLVVSLIIENRNGRGANIEKVVSEAEKRGMGGGEVLSDIERLKFEGYAYQHKNGEICYVY